MKTQAEIAAERATYAHKTSRENQAGPMFGRTPVGQYFKDGAMNRDPHNSDITETAPAGTPMGRTVTVIHRHYKDQKD